MLEPRNPSRTSHRYSNNSDAEQRSRSRRIPRRTPQQGTPTSKITGLADWQSRQEIEATESSPRPGRIQGANPEPTAAESENSFNLRNLLFGAPATPPSSGTDGSSRREVRRSSRPNRVAPDPRGSAAPSSRAARTMMRTGSSSFPIDLPSRPIRSSPVRRSPFEPIPLQTEAVQSPYQPALERGERGLERSIQAPKNRPRRVNPPLLYLFRLLILGVGVAAIAGTLLSVMNPAARQSYDLLQASLEPGLSAPTNASPTHANSLAAQRGVLSALTLKLGQENAELKAIVQDLAVAIPDLSLGVFLMESESGEYLDYNGATIFSAASTIKVPILVAFLQEVDAGKIRLDEILTIEEEDYADGSGEMQFQAPGTAYTALETAEMMITISDNTATNILIRRLGGAEVLNQRFQSWGMPNTVIRSPLADLSGTNTTTPKELTELLAKVSQGELLSLRSRDRLMEIMQRTVADSLLPAGTADDQAIIAHKTGTIDNMIGDTGIIDIPNGRRYILTILVERSADDERAQDLIRQVAGTVYDFMINPNATADSPPPIATENPPAAIEETTPELLPEEDMPAQSESWSDPLQ